MLSTLSFILKYAKARVGWGPKIIAKKKKDRNEADIKKATREVTETQKIKETQNTVNTQEEGIMNARESKMT